jgi:hypothetical protein
MIGSLIKKLIKAAGAVWNNCVISGVKDEERIANGHAQIAIASGC